MSSRFSCAGGRHVGKTPKTSDTPAWRFFSMRPQNTEQEGEVPPDFGVRTLWQLVRWFLVLAGWASAVALTCIAAARLLTHDATLLFVWLNSFTLYIYLPAYAVFVFALVARHWWLGLLAGVPVVLHLVWVTPDYVGHAAAAPATGPSLALFSANLLANNEQGEAMAEEIRASDADVVLLQEYSTRWHRALRASGVLDPYPHQVSRVRDDSFGTAIYSKFPFVDAGIIDLEGLPMSTARVTFVGRVVDIVNVHTLPPRVSAYLPAWRAQTAWLRERAQAAKDPLILLGDFNATQHSLAYAGLLQAGLVDSHREVGRGDATTFPNGLAPVPPIRIDHVFHTRELTCISLSEGVGAGSDHRPLTARLTWH